MSFDLKMNMNHSDLFWSCYFQNSYTVCLGELVPSGIDSIEF
ncbi:hypothetical protein PPM_0428 [Paenibacillus polymyxa M1]|nr:hypothetical protein PPM_0428 [Paenibacillus polymyxa M1]